MRVVFTVSAWPTHYLCMVPLGWALQAAGHEVRVLCAPSQVAPVSRAGLLPVPLLDGIDVAVHSRLEYYQEAVTGRWPYPWLPLHPVTGTPLAALDDFDLAAFHRRQLPRIAARAGRGFDRAVGFSRDWRPDLVVHDPKSLEGLLTGRLLDRPALLALWGPTGTREPAGPALLADDLSGAFVRYGLGEFHPDLVSHVIDPCPPDLRPPTGAARLPVRYVPYNQGGRAPGWIRRHGTRPRVCVTWSTALTTMSGPRSYVLPQVVRRLAGLGVEVVVTATRRDLAALGPLPRLVRTLERCPLQLLLPTCAAVVHHGGAGSTLTAVHAGVPQVVLSFASEQARNGERVATAGAGRHLPGHLIGADAAAVGDAVGQVLESPAYRQRAAWLRAQLLRRPTPADLVRTLERLAAG